jgi:soluble lytic murein transglycosylase-like protein
MTKYIIITITAILLFNGLFFRNNNKQKPIKTIFTLKINPLNKYKKVLLKACKNTVKNYIKYYSKIYKVSPALVKGIIKEESNNGRYLKSPAGACGIMQIEPATALFITHKHISCEELIKNKKLNIKIGIEYLSFLLKNFSQIAYAIAGYNAGYNAALYFLKTKHLPTSANPTDNVHHYVLKVLKFSKRYKAANHLYY